MKDPYRDTYHCPDLRIPASRDMENEWTDSGCRAKRQEETGSFRYLFTCGDRILGSATALVQRDFPLVIRRDGLIFNTRIDPEQTVFPGARRDVLDADDPRLVYARVTLLGKGRHRLELNPEEEVLSVDVRSAEDAHWFYVDGECVARILPSGAAGGDWSERYRLDTRRELTDELAMLFLCFPLLQLFG